MSASTAPLPVFSSSPTRAIQAMFDSPNWITNLLWLSIAVIANSVIVGQIGLFGYGSELLQSRAGRPENRTPDIDSNRLGDYISQGLWPFLVYFVVQIAASVLVAIPIAITFAVGIGLGAAIGGDAGAGIAMIAVIPITIAFSVLSAVFTVPFLIRAMICQDFQASFDIGWAINFVRLMFGEIFISALLFGLLAMLITMAGFLLLCVGYIPAAGLVSGGMMHLLAQWYEVYLSRGGEPVSPARQREEIVDATIV